MEKEFIQSRLHQVEMRSIQLYTERQNLEMQRQQIQISAMQIDNELVKLDGQRELLQSLIPQGLSDDGK